MTSSSNNEHLWTPTNRPRFVIGDPENDQGMIALIGVGKGGNPYRGNLIVKNYRYADLVRSKKDGPATIVIGENGGGLSTLVHRVLRWLGTQSSYQWWRVVCDVVDAHELESALLKDSPGKWDASTSIAQPEGNGVNKLMLLEQLHRYPPAMVAAIAPKLRARFENDADFGLFIVGEDPLLFAADEELFSDVATVSDIYRIPWWSAPQIEHASGPLAPTPAVAQACIDWTGGQPTLTQAFLDESLQEHDARLNWGDTDAAGYSLVGLQSSRVSSWQIVLRRLCRKQERKEVVRALVSGQRFEHHRLPAAGHPLFLAGWMCWTPAQHWHMPYCHRHWARQVLLGG